MNDSDARTEHRRLLFRTAVLVMACDGEIHADEIKELRLAHRKTTYFAGLDFDAELARLREKVESDKHEVVREYFEALGRYEFDPVQQLQVLELALRIIYADQRVHENERKFCQMIQRVLQVPEPIVEKRFGSVPFLAATAHDRKSMEADLTDAIVDRLAIPEIEDLKAVEG